MASTNHTTNYNLPQYVGGDKPTYLGDFNTAMAAIDTQMKLNADNAAQAIGDSASAVSVANTANTTANTANSKADANTSSINTITGTTIPAVQSTANSALLQANTNTTAIANLDTEVDTVNTKVETVASKLNLTSFETISYTSFTKTGGGSILGGTVYTATNADGSLGKIYGQYDVKTNNSSGTITIPTQLRPKDNNGDPTDLTINGIVIRAITSGSTVVNNAMLTATIRSNGNVEIDYTAATGADNNCRIMIMASVLFLTPFNDEPITPGE